MKWLIAPEELTRATERHEYLTSLATRSVAQLAAELGMDAEAVAAVETDALLGPDLRVQDGVATIAVRGVLLDEPNWLYDLFGIEYSHYAGIVDQVEQAVEDPRVQSVVLDVDSPGGLVRGVFEAADKIFGATKPVRARVRGRAASAAYLLASQADEIVATGRADEIGSIGVAVDMYVSPNAVSIASTDAPNKRPDVRTDTGRAVVREELDAIHDLFVGVVVRGRGVSEAAVRERFGRGGVLLAGEAAAVGMIDALASVEIGGRRAASGDMVRGMTLDVLRVSHPEVYAAAVAEGTKQERARCVEHLKLGEDNGALQVASAAIREGSGLDASVVVQYARIGAARDLVAARGAEAPEARGADAAAPVNRDESRTHDVFAAAARKLGQECAA